MLTFLSILAVIGTALIVIGFVILNDRRLEMVALAGVYPVMWGLGMDALAAVLFVIHYVRIDVTIF